MYAPEEDRKIDLISVPRKSFWRLSIPIAVFLLFETFYSIIDMVWLVNYSQDAAFAVSACAPVLLLVTTFGDSIGQGTNSIMSRFIGSGNYEGAYNSLVHGIILSIIMSALVVFSLPLMDEILIFFDIGNTELINTYLYPIILCSSSIIFTNFFSETMQAEGNSRTPVMIIIMSNIVNLILDPILIFGLDMGITGAALASASSSVLCMACFLYLYLSGRTKVPLSLGYFSLSGHICFEISKVAVPNFIDDAAYCFMSFFINGVLMTVMGTIGVLLYSVSLKIKYLIVAPVKGMGRGLMSVCGHLFGAKKIDDLYGMYLYVLKVSTAVVIVIALIFFAMRDLIYASFMVVGMEASIFSIALGGIVILLCYPLYFISSKMLNGFGKSYYALALNLLKTVFVLGMLVILADIVDGGSAVLISIIAGEIVFAVAYFGCLKYLIRRFKSHLDELVVT